MNKRKGISLIVLVITILVMIILAGVVVVSLQKNNPIEKAKEANFKTKVSTYVEELSLTVANNIANGNTEKINENNNLKQYISSFSEDDRGKFIIENSKLVYMGDVLEEEIFAESVGCVSKAKRQEIFSIDIPKEKQVIDGLNATNTFKLGKTIDIEDNIVIEFEAKPSREVNFENLKDNNIENQPMNLLINPHNGYFVKGKPNAAGVGVVLGTNGIAVVEHADSWYPYKAIYKADLSQRHKYKVIIENNTMYVYVDGVKVAEEKEEKYDLLFSNNNNMYLVGKGFYSETFMGKYGYFQGELYNLKISTMK